jgi:hypothetical protein
MQCPKSFISRFFLILSCLFYSIQAPVLAAVDNEGMIYPEAGSPLRATILDELRDEVVKNHGLEVVFQVSVLRVLDGWAWVEVLPQSPNGKSNYEGITALLEKKQREWVPVCYPYCNAADEDCNIIISIEKCRENYPQAPSEIFHLTHWEVFKDPASGVSFRYPPGWKISLISCIVSAGPAAEKQKKNVITRLSLTPPANVGKITQNDNIVINPIRGLPMYQSLGTCYCDHGNYLCTYSKNKNILNTLDYIVESFSPGFLQQTPCTE